MSKRTNKPADPKTVIDKLSRLQSTIARATAPDVQTNRLDKLPLTLGPGRSMEERFDGFGQDFQIEMQRMQQEINRKLRDQGERDRVRRPIEQHNRCHCPQCYVIG